MKLPNQMDGKRKKNECPKCGKIYMLASSLKTHMLSHAVSNYGCSKCPSTFSDEELLRKHTSESHFNVIQDFDDLCFKSEKKNQKKLKVYHRLFRCSKCPETFTKKGELQAHSSSHGSDCSSVAVAALKSCEISDVRKDVVTKLSGDKNILESIQLDSKSSFPSHGFERDVLKISLWINPEVLNENSDACKTVISIAHPNEDIKSGEGKHESRIERLQIGPQNIIDNSVNAEGDQNIANCIYIAVNTGVSFIPRTEWDKTDVCEAASSVNEQTVSNSVLLEKHPLSSTEVDQSEHFIALFKCHSCPMTFFLKQEIDSHISNQCNVDSFKEIEHLEEAAAKTGILVQPLNSYDIIFKCTHCPLICLNKQEIENHISSHGDNLEDKCLQKYEDGGRSIILSEEKTSTVLLDRYLTTSFQNSKDEADCTRKVYTCSVCSKVFSNNKKFMDHKRIHGNRKHVCEICGKSFRAKSYLLVHVSVHSEMRPHVCKDCNKGFKSLPALKKHEVIHLDKRPFECSVCGANFKRKNALTLHAIVHSASRPHECEKCKKTFKNHRTLKGHMELHKDKNTNAESYFCIDCRKSYSSLQNYHNHMRYHAGNFPYKCQYCEKGFVTKSFLTQHLRIHTGERPYKCTLCQKKFTLRSTLRNHMDTHSSTKRYMCHICGVHLTYRQALAMHVKMHTGVREHECSVCNKKFFLKCNYNRHMRIHNGERPYQCLICSKTFKQGAHLKTHMASHRNEKPYQCNVCDKFFVYRSSLQNHMATHSTDKPFVCEKCGKGFKSRGSLKIHVLTHNTEQKFECPDCGKKFKLESSLHIHLKKKSDGTHVCQLCKMVFMRRACLYQHKKMHLVEMELDDSL